MKNIISLCSIVGILVSTPLLHAAEPWQEVSTFSCFNKIELDKLVAGEVAGNRVPAPSSKYGMSVETLYLVPMTTKQTLAKMREDDGAASESSETLGREGRYFFGAPSSVANFSKLSLDPKKGPDKSLIKKTSALPLKNEINLSKAEADKLGASYKSLASANNDPMKNGAPALAQVWQEILAGESGSYQRGGVAALAGYDNQNPPIRVDAGLNEMLQSRAPVSSRFASLLQVAFSGNAEAQKSAKPLYFWERQRIQGDTTFNLGAFFEESTPHGYRAVELQYFVTSKYYTSLILYELWPVTYMDKQFTLVWRGDYVLTPYIPFVKGIERLAAENIMLIEIKKSVKTTLLQSK